MEAPVDSWTLILLAGAVLIWAAMLTAVAYVVRVRA